MITLATTNTLQAVAGTATAITYSVLGMEYASSAEVYKVLSQGQLATSAAALYTVPASTVAFVKMILLANTTGSAVSGIILYINGTAASNQITPSMTIPANGFATFDTSGWKIYDNTGTLYTTGAAFDSTAPNTTTPLAASSSGTLSIAARRDHTHQSAGGISSIVAATAGINSTETIVTSAVIPASLMVAGTTFRVTASGVCTSSAANASNFRVRIGTAGSSADSAAAVITPTAAATGTAIPFFVDFLVTVRTSGSSGTGLGGGMLLNNGVTGVSAAAVVVGQVTSTITINTTVSNTIQLSYVAAASTTTCTFHDAAIVVVKM
jgi:hypothetical protein